MTRGVWLRISKRAIRLTFYITSGLTSKYSYRSISTSHIRCLELRSPSGRVHRGALRLRNRCDGDFIALSYTWGSSAPSNHRKIEIAGQGYVPLTQNLQDALFDLCSSSLSTKVIFIDQVCINQDNSREKSFQVAKMGDVYRYANQVVTYLGPSEYEDSEALDLLDRIGDWFGDWFDDLDDDNDGDMLDRFVRRKEIPHHLQRFELDDSDEDALRHLEGIVYDGGWTNRLWMVQENLLNRDIIFLRGSRTISRKLIHMLPFCQSFGLLPKPKYVSPANFRQALVVADAYRDFFQKSREQSFIKLINAFGTTMGCSNPKDKIYALMGLAENNWEVEPDYAADTLDVYMDFVIKSIEETKTLDIFNSVDKDHRKPTCAGYWPSWVPAFSKDVSLTIRGRASGTTVPRIDHNGKRLKVKGYEVDRIAKVIVTFRSEAYVHGSISRNNLRDIVQKLERAKECLEQNGFEYPGDDLCFAILGSSESPDPWFSDSFRHRAEYGFQCAMDILRSALDEGNDPCTFQPRKGGSFDDKLGDLIISNLNVSDRSLCLTKSKKLVLTTKTVTSGDSVVVLLGGGPLYIIREFQQCYEMVGPAFMDGFMEGQSLYDVDWNEELRWVFERLYKKIYVDLANRPIFSGEPNSMVYEIRKKNDELQSSARDIAVSLIGIQTSSDEQVMLFRGGNFEEEFEKFADSVSSDQLEILSQAITKGPFKPSTNGSWRKDWWYFMEYLWSREVVAEPKWKKSLKDYTLL